jgi:hypothetical protein
MEEDHHAMVPSIQPLKGHIAPMRTLQEISPSVEFGLSTFSLFLSMIQAYRKSGDAYTIEIIQKCASQVSKYAFPPCMLAPTWLIS